jgi:hypothetical protein
MESEGLYVDYVVWSLTLYGRRHGTIVKRRRPNRARAGHISLQLRATSCTCQATDITVATMKSSLAVSGSH